MEQPLEARRPGPSLPSATTTFVGRRGELGDMRRALTSSRLVTLVGPGGVGKTRLALASGRTLERSFRDGIWFVDLSVVPDGANIADELVTALNCPPTPGLDQTSLLVEFIGSRESLLVLDTCEHVLDTTAAVVRRLLAETPGLRILATSRERLQLTGEQVFPVEPFRIGPGGPSDDTPVAIELFAQRANAVVPGFQVDGDNRQDIATICRLLDGLPLAIELAALQMPLFAVSDLLARIDKDLGAIGPGPRSVPDRQRTIEASLEWSYRLCPPNEQLLWAHCSVFSGGFDMPAAEEICAVGDLSGTDVLDAVSGLLAKSILLRESSGGAVRFRVLDSVRQYGARRLAESDHESTVRNRHAHWMVALARQGESEWLGPNQARWLDKIEDERGNVRAAIAYLLDQGEAPEAAVELVASLWFHWISAGQLGEGAAHLTRAVEAVDAASNIRNKGTWTLGMAAHLQLQYDDAQSLARACLTESEPAGDLEASANANHVLGCSSIALGHMPEAEKHLLAALDLFRRAGVEDTGSVMARIHLSMTYAFQGRADEAKATMLDCLARCEKAGDQWARSYVTQLLALGCFLEGRLAEGSRLALSGLAAGRRLRDARAVIPRMDLLAWFAAAEGDSARAATLLGAAERLWRIDPNPSYRTDRFMALRAHAIQQARGDLGESRYDSARQAGFNLDLDHALAYALDGGPTGSAGTATANKLPYGLTKREVEIAELVAEGMSNKEIAQTLVLSPRTVENHVQRILTKLGFTSRTQIAVWSIRESGRKGS